MPLVKRRSSKERQKILITGFEPFGGETINPSQAIAQNLHGTEIGGHEVVGVLLPCVFGAANRELSRQLRAIRPSLVVCLGQAGGRAAITPERVAILQKADAIYLDEIRKAGLYDKIWQAFAVLLPVRSVGVMGDARTYESVLALRAVTSTDGMTADFYQFDMNFLGRCATRIINEVKGVSRVVYDVTSKPPGTIEWE